MTDASKNIGWIGIGKMGLPMSVLVAKAGYAVTAFDQSAARIAAAQDQGISIAGSAAEAVRGRAAVITSLPDDDVLHTVMLGAGGIIGGAGPIAFYEKHCGATVIDGSVPGIYRGMLK